MPYPMTTEELIGALERGDTVEHQVVIRLREQEAEIERLRAALKKIAAMPETPEDEIYAAVSVAAAALRN